MICSVENWNRRDGKFDLRRFYNAILASLDPETGPSEEWIEDTLRWWNEYVFFF
jgi:hypothetical protein